MSGASWFYLNYMTDLFGHNIIKKKHEEPEDYVQKLRNQVLEEQKRYNNLLDDKIIEAFGIPKIELLEIIKKHKGESKMTNELFENVREWGRNKGIIFDGNQFKQALKTMEEVGELAGALSKDNKQEIADAYGDIIVTVIVGAACMGLNAEDCLEDAYNIIAKRTGKLVDGVFVKD